jgi:hypothetical protein
MSFIYDYEGKHTFTYEIEVPEVIDPNPSNLPLRIDGSPGWEDKLVARLTPRSNTHDPTLLRQLFHCWVTGEDFSTRVTVDDIDADLSWLPRRFFVHESARVAKENWLRKSVNKIGPIAEKLAEEVEVNDEIQKTIEQLEEDEERSRLLFDVSQVAWDELRVRVDKLLHTTVLYNMAVSKTNNPRVKSLLEQIALLTPIDKAEFDSAYRLSFLGCARDGPASYKDLDLASFKVSLEGEKVGKSTPKELLTLMTTSPGSNTAYSRMANTQANAKDKLALVIHDTTVQGQGIMLTRRGEVLCTKRTNTAFNAVAQKDAYSQVKNDMMQLFPTKFTKENVYKVGVDNLFVPTAELPAFCARYKISCKYHGGSNASQKVLSHVHIMAQSTGKDEFKCTPLDHKVLSHIPIVGAGADHTIMAGVIHSTAGGTDFFNTIGATIEDSGKYKQTGRGLFDKYYKVTKSLFIPHAKLDSFKGEVATATGVFKSRELAKPLFMQFYQGDFMKVAAKKIGLIRNIASEITLGGICAASAFLQMRKLNVKKIDLCFNANSMAHQFGFTVESSDFIDAFDMFGKEVIRADTIKIAKKHASTVKWEPFKYSDLDSVTHNRYVRDTKKVPSPGTVLVDLAVPGTLFSPQSTANALAGETHQGDSLMIDDHMTRGLYKPSLLRTLTAFCVYVPGFEFWDENAHVWKVICEEFHVTLHQPSVLYTHGVFVVGVKTDDDTRGLNFLQARNRMSLYIFYKRKLIYDLFTFIPNFVAHAYDKNKKVLKKYFEDEMKPLRAKIGTFEAYKAICTGSFSSDDINADIVSLYHKLDVKLLSKDSSDFETQVMAEYDGMESL